MQDAGEVKTIFSYFCLLEYKQAFEHQIQVELGWGWDQNNVTQMSLYPVIGHCPSWEKAGAMHAIHLFLIPIT